MDPFCFELNHARLTALATRPYTKENPLRLGVLISGNGSNLQALIDHSHAVDARFTIATVISNCPTAFGLQRAQNAGIHHGVVNHLDYPNRAAFESELLASLAPFNIEIVVLAGFMRIVGQTLLGAFSNRIINLHPSLLPSFKGLDAPQQALDAGVRFTGCTVHVVDAGCDTGPILGQAVVAVHEKDTLADLSQRIHQSEHRLLPLVINSITGSAA